MSRIAKKSHNCRKCGHMRYYHCVFATLQEGDSTTDYMLIVEDIPCHIGVSRPDGSYGQCNCIGYSPADNLEYLQHKYEQKEDKK